jgi:hypothetical protein
MRKQDAGFDYHRYRQLLSEAVDEQKRLAFIDLLIEERAKERLDAQRAADRMAMTATTIAQVLGTRKPDLADIAKPSRAAVRSAPVIARMANSR